MVTPSQTVPLAEAEVGVLVRQKELMPRIQV